MKVIIYVICNILLICPAVIATLLSVSFLVFPGMKYKGELEKFRPGARLDQADFEPMTFRECAVESWKVFSTIMTRNPNENIRRIREIR